MYNIWGGKSSPFAKAWHMCKRFKSYVETGLAREVENGLLDAVCALRFALWLGQGKCLNGVMASSDQDSRKPRKQIYEQRGELDWTGQEMKTNGNNHYISGQKTVGLNLSSGQWAWSGGDKCNDGCYISRRDTPSAEYIQFAKLSKVTESALDWKADVCVQWRLEGCREERTALRRHLV